MSKKIYQDNFLTFAGKSEVGAKPKERNIGEEVSNKKNYQTKVIDQFEKSLGINPPRKKRNVRYLHRIFSVDFEKDALQFDELMNNPKFEIVSFKDTWTVEGLYKVAVLYLEDLDYQSSEDKIKTIAEGKNDE